MTSWMPDLDGSAALLAELRGDPCFTEPDVPAPRCAERWRDLTASLLRNSATDAHSQDPS
jgi:hypothetical protein